VYCRFVVVFAFAFLVVIPSGASEPAVSRFLPVPAQSLCLSSGHMLLVLTTCFLGGTDEEREEAGSLPFASLEGRNDN
jgi:hypothetical protein